MTRIDFYILEDLPQAARHRFACRLTARALDSGEPVTIHTADANSSEELDELLWHYPDGRFLPHATSTAGVPSRAPVLITSEEPPAYEGVLINLTANVPHFFNRFRRVAEVVVQSELEAGRERYRFYRHRGYPLYDHRMDDWDSESVGR